MDNRITAGLDGSISLEPALRRLKDTAIAQNASEAAKLGIPEAAAVTCVKPSGTVSQLVDAASGIHPRHSRFYIRRVRGAIDDPLTAFLEAEGVPCEPCVYNDKVKVFSFPIASPDGAVVRDDLSAIDQLQLCLTYQQHWCEHKPSVTVTVREHEWDAVEEWVYEHFDELAGVSFLPYDMGTYQQTPYEAVEFEEYARLAAQVPKSIDWGRFRELERHARDDNVGLDLACSNGACEHVGEPLPQASVA